METFAQSPNFYELVEAYHFFDGFPFSGLLGNGENPPSCCWMQYRSEQELAFQQYDRDYAVSLAPAELGVRIRFEISKFY